MAFKSITATISVQMLDKVEKRLRTLGVPGISVSETKGYGVYKNFFQRDWLVTHARIQIYVSEEQVDRIVNAIMDAAHTGIEDDGIIAIREIAHLYRICDKSEVTPDHF